MLFKTKKKRLNKSTFIRTEKTDSFFIKKKKEVLETLDLLSKLSYDISLTEVGIVLIILCSIGLVFGFLLKNIFVSLFAAIGFPLIGVQLLLLKKKSLELIIERQIIAYAELIKNSFVSTNSVVVTLKELTPRIEMPLQAVFEDCIRDIEVYNVSVPKSLENITHKMNFNSLNELVQQLILCEKDRRFVSSLITTTQFLSDKREFLQMWDYQTKQITQRYFFVLGMINLIVCSFYFLFNEMTVVFLASPSSVYIIAIYMLIQLIVTYRALSYIQSINL